MVDGWALYCATKAGGEMFFNVLASQVNGDGRVTLANVDPGQMHTGMQADIRRAAAGRAYFPGQQRGWTRTPRDGWPTRPRWPSGSSRSTCPRPGP